MPADRAVADALRALVREDPPAVQEPSGRKRSHHDTKFHYGQHQKSEIHKASKKRVKQPHTVEALMVSDIVYLKDPKTCTVYSTDRDTSGELVAVGKWDGAKILRAPREHTVKGEENAVVATSDAAAQQSIAQRRGTLQNLNFTVADPADHCETCVESYRDIQDLLSCLCKELGKDAATLRIYDPYYCTGATKRLFGSMGFTNVYNENEDFYEKIAAGSVPDYDILVTNPPFSADHVDKLIEYVRQSGLPWALLMPTYVAKKAFYLNMVSTAKHKPFYVVPKKRYVFFTPKGVNRGNKRFNKRGRTSPYVTMWFIQGGATSSKILSAQTKRRSQHGGKARFYVDVESLPTNLF